MSIDESIVIHVFTRDFRLADNPSLFHANQFARVWPIYIYDYPCDPFPPGEASRWWLYQSIMDVQSRLGGELSIFVGEFSKVIEDLVSRYPIKGVFWNRCFDEYRRQQQEKTLDMLKQRAIAARCFNGSTLWDPWAISKSDGSCYKVFTPFYRKGCLQGYVSPRPVEPTPASFNWTNLDRGVGLDQSGILPQHTWHKKLSQHWSVGESAAQERLRDFLASGVQDYKVGRDFPAKNNVSQLSPYLHYGNISASQVWRKVSELPQDKNTDHFMSELGWREFAYYLLFHCPRLPHANLQTKFDQFPWVEDSKKLYAWQRGQTGIPIVDAGMRQLWQSGYMHNRLRMIVGSFLVKNLRHNWREGEAWFRDCLVDFDLANNSAAWQWVAGCGTDAAPYFRIFNPVTQGQRFDPDGIYTKQYLPELSRLPVQYLFDPWNAPQSVLNAAGVVLGESYPYPIVDLKESRQKALDEFQSLSR